MVEKMEHRAHFELGKSSGLDHDMVRGWHCEVLQLRSASNGAKKLSIGFVVCVGN